ncbi:hypothetical protein GWO43_08575 [candidate division KSB1 bacterium]|nr:hypothetical protein [candidate division KSB1 bacterium]NIR68770.1 hypothetical protein [candidate division KSB1 bacterium]NIS24008.1 hypothetical protein [candidate division KSB1 bacterium]NIT70935.1 hypothetical protein [candidate division KSB1 bacterium]NIU24656.1 hypothetical protein [candidate division KSB1 bacterium]
MISTALTGSISGLVTNPEHLPTAFAIADGDRVTSTPFEQDSGEFRLAFLPEVLYTVSVRDTLDQSEEVTVKSGEDNHLGSITLTE